jgi:hypothetical protein
MERFISGIKLTEEIRNLFSTATGNNNICCAVAFWGQNAKELINNCHAATIKIICNLDSGATNPYFVEKFYRHKTVNIRNLPKLHAKVYFGADRAIVCSANASANGLGFCDKEIAGWIEAGVILKDENSLTLIQKWFDERWKDSKKIGLPDIENAKILWEKRRKNLPTVLFLDFPENKLSDIRLCEIPNLPKFVTHKEAVKKSIGYYNDAIEERIQNDSIDIIIKRDEKSLPKGSWVLCWPMTKDERLSKKDNFEWFYVGPYIPAAGHYENTEDQDQPLGVVIGGDNPPPPPFNVQRKKDPNFRKAFEQTIQDNDFNVLRDDSPFKKQTGKVLTGFWNRLRKNYTELLTK